MTKAEVYRRYRVGYVEVSMDEWMEIYRAFEGNMTSPGGVVGRFGISRQAVLQAAKAGRLYYFVVTKPFLDRGYVLIPLEGLEGVFRRKQSKAV